MRRSLVRAAVLAVLLVAGLPALAGAEVFKRFFVYEPGIDTAVFDRWLFKTHSQEVQFNMPIILRYWVFRAFHMPPEADRFNTYRGRITEIYHDLKQMQEWRSSRFDYTPPPKGWEGWQIAAPKPTVLAFLPATPTEDFLGKHPGPKDTPYLRWVMVFKYPEGVAKEAAEKWYLETHVPEAKLLAGLRRFVSYRPLPAGAVDRQDQGWVRVSELWFDDYRSWRASVIESPPAFTPPPWTESTRLEDFFPGLVSTFVGERPDADLKNDYLPYP